MHLAWPLLAVPRTHIRWVSLVGLVAVVGCTQPARNGGGGGTGGGSTGASCGNGICEGSEATTCPADCSGGGCTSPCTAAMCTAAGDIQDCITNDSGCKVLTAPAACPAGKACTDGKCVEQQTCGDGTCGAGENATCPLDCPSGCTAPCFVAKCGPGGGLQACTAGPDGCAVLGTEAPCPSGSNCSDGACVTLSTEHAEIVSVNFTGEKTAFPTYMAPMFGKTIDGQKFAVIPELVLTNPTGEARTVEVKAWLQGYSEEGGTNAPIVLAPGESKTISVDIPFTCGKLDSIVTEITASYKVALYENGVEVDARKVNVKMLPKSTVLWLPPEFESKDPAAVKEALGVMRLIATSLYTTKNDAWGEVDKLVAEASKLSPVGLTGFSFESKSAANQAELAGQALVAIFKALKARGVAYSSVGTDFFGGSQNIRYPAESLTVGSQNCVDGALVFASALERMGYRPIVVYVPGHAFVGARATKTGPSVFIETTMVGSSSAEKAVQVAAGEVLENFDKAGQYGFEPKQGNIAALMVDVRALHEEGGLPSSFFPCGAKPAPAADPCGSNPQCKCQKSLNCMRNGECTVVSSGSGCGVTGDADCKQSTDCKDWGKCSAVMKDGKMVCDKAGSGPVCGNGACEAGENSTNCAKDCGGPVATCGDLKCAAGEASACPLDCATQYGPELACVAQTCGGQWSACMANATCKGILNCYVQCGCNDGCVNGCMADAGGAQVFTQLTNCMIGATCPEACPTSSPVCGNGSCEAGETASNCSQDCAAAGSCANNCGMQVGSCYCDDACSQSGDCCPDYGFYCAATPHPCDAACGGQAASGCYCDALCKGSSDCCSASGEASQASCAGSTCAACQ